MFGVSYIWYLLHNTVVRLCQFLVLAGNRFWFYILMYLGCDFFERVHMYTCTHWNSADVCGFFFQMALSVFS